MMRYAVVVCCLSGMFGTASASAGVTGAIFPTVAGCADHQDHFFASKQDIYVDGGPKGGGAGIPTGTYWVQVTAPNGAVLGQSTSADVSVTNGSFADCYQLWSLVQQSDSSQGFADTPNPGDNYKLWVCEDNTFTESTCLTKVFKVGVSVVHVQSGPTVSKDANGSYTDTFAWGITKSVDHSTIDTAGSATANYTVNVTHDAGTVSDISVIGTIQVNNPEPYDVNIDGVSDALSDGTVCTVDNGGPQTIPAQTIVPLTYSCSPSDTSATSNTVTVSWSDQDVGPNTTLDGGSNPDTVPITWTANNVNDCVDVSDSALSDPLGSVCSTNASPTTFTYSKTFANDTAGTCTDHPNTATYVAEDDSTVTNSASQSVKVCVGKDLQVSKDAATAFTRRYNWSIAKSVNKTLAEQFGGGTASFNYGVTASETGFTDSGWTVSGTIHVKNPNDWESVSTSSVTDSIDNGGTCTVTGGASSIAAGATVDLPYMCTYPSAPTASSGTNSATANWDSSAAHTPDGSANGTHDYAFTTPTSTINKTITVTDSTQTGNLGTVTATDSSPLASKTFNYSYAWAVPTSNCTTHKNTATIVETGQTDSKTVETCGPAATGALTIGYWQNNNGQAAINGAGSTSGVCNLTSYLRGYAPFTDLSATATCSQVATYANNVVKAANASGASMNAMLKAQMLSTALSVYFKHFGALVIDLTKVGSSMENTSAAFGGATSLSVNQILSYAASQYLDSTHWYGQNKATQGLAKDTFDAINNQLVFAP
jgi:hypothetical protein